MPLIRKRRSSRKRRRVHRSRHPKNHHETTTTELESHNNTCSIMDIEDPSLLSSKRFMSESQRSIQQQHRKEQMSDIWSKKRVAPADYEQNPRHPKRTKRRCCSQWSCLCALLLLLSLFCLGVALAAILIALLVPSSIPKTTSTTSMSTTTVTSTTSTTTSSTVSTSTTTTSTSSTATTSTSTSTTSTTSSSTTSTTSSSTTSTTSTTTTDTTSTSTTTTTRPVCNASCVSTLTLNTIPVVARFNFENTYADSMLTYNATPINGPTFTAGYVNRAVSLDTSATSYLSTPFIPIDSQSFTVDVWVYPTGFPNPSRLHTIMGICPQQTAQQCLQLFLRYNATMGYATTVFGVWENADLKGIAPIRANTWTHIAFVYRNSSRQQIIYVNGVYDNSRSGSNGFNGTSGPVYIGNNLNLVGNPSFGANSFQGYIDQIIVSDGIRPACEVFNVAALAARFPFENLSHPLDNYGPNDVTVNAPSYQLVDGVKGDQAIFLNSSSSHYFGVSGFRFLSYNSVPLSISLWLQPTVRQGIIVGSSLGFSPLAFAANGSLIAQIDSYSVIFAGPIELAPVWTHIVMAWSSANGLRLYVNTQLVGNVAASTTMGSGATTNTLTLGGGLFVGAIDDWCVYSRELATGDICNLFIA